METPAIEQEPRRRNLLQEMITLQETPAVEQEPRGFWNKQRVEEIERVMLQEEIADKTFGRISGKARVAVPPRAGEVIPAEPLGAGVKSAGGTGGWPILLSKHASSNIPGVNGHGFTRAETDELYREVAQQVRREQAREQAREQVRE